MRFCFIITVTLVVLSLALIGCQQTATVAVGNISGLIDSLEQKFEWLDYRIAVEEWDLYTKGTSDSLQFYQGLYNHLLSDQKTYDRLKRGQSKLTSEIDLRRYDLITQAFVLGRIETSAEIAQLRDSLSGLDIAYRSVLNGDTLTQGQLHKLYRSDKNREKREEAYRAYVGVGDKIADGLAQLIRLRNRQAKKLGYNNFFALSFKQFGFSTDEYIKMLTMLDTISEQPYLEILNRLQGKLGIDYPEIWDLGFAYQQVNSQVDSYFPVDSQLNLIDRSMERIGFDIDHMPIYYDLDSRENKSQFAYAFTIKAPYDMRVLANLVDGLYSTTVLMHEVGHTVSSAQIIQDQPIFRGNLNGAWSEAIAQIFAALTDDKEWLTNYGGLTSALSDEYLKGKREEDVIYLRLSLMRLQFEYEAYLNPNRDLNELYWGLFEKYMRLPRHDDLKPWASIIHLTTHPVYLQNYLYADMIAAQTISFLRDNYTTITDNPSTGAFLAQNYLRFGSRYDWRELLKRGTGEDLNPDYFIKRLGLISN